MQEGKFRTSYILLCEFKSMAQLEEINISFMKGRNLFDEHLRVAILCQEAHTLLALTVIVLALTVILGFREFSIIDLC